MNLDELLNAFSAGPQQLEDSLAGLDEDQWDLTPIDGQWSFREVVCHLADYELINAERIKRVLAEASAMGYKCQMGPELEFFLFRAGEDGVTSPLPHDQGGYFDQSTDLAVEVRKDMVNALTAFGIQVEASHHEVATGQHEIDFQYADALRAADNSVTFKYALKAVAQGHGLYATFMPKPIM